MSSLTMVAASLNVAGLKGLASLKKKKCKNLKNRKKRTKEEVKSPGENIAPDENEIEIRDPQESTKEFFKGNEKISKKISNKNKAVLPALAESYGLKKGKGGFSSLQGVDLAESPRKKIGKVELPQIVPLKVQIPPFPADMETVRLQGEEIARHAQLLRSEKEKEKAALNLENELEVMEADIALENARLREAEKNCKRFLAMKQKYEDDLKKLASKYENMTSFFQGMVEEVKETRKARETLISARKHNIEEFRNVRSIRLRKQKEKRETKSGTPRSIKGKTPRSVKQDVALTRPPALWKPPPTLDFQADDISYPPSSPGALSQRSGREGQGKKSDRPPSGRSDRSAPLPPGTPRRVISLAEHQAKFGTLKKSTTTLPEKEGREEGDKVVKKSVTSVSGAGGEVSPGKSRKLVMFRTPESLLRKGDDSEGPPIILPPLEQEEEPEEAVKEEERKNLAKLARERKESFEDLMTANSPASPATVLKKQKSKKAEKQKKEHESGSSSKRFYMHLRKLNTIETRQNADVDEPVIVMAAEGVEVDVTELTRKDGASAIRQCLIVMAGSVEKAYKMMDHNGNGKLSLLELKQGFDQIKIPWKELTGMKFNDLFKLIDTNNSGDIDIHELVGYRVSSEWEWQMMTTQQQWAYYVLKVKQLLEEIEHRQAKLRRPKWEPQGPDEELELILEERRVNERHYWIREWMKLMFKKGHTEISIVAKHLPSDFDEERVKIDARQDMESIASSVRSIEKMLRDYGMQRKELEKIKHDLDHIAQSNLKREAELRRRQQEDEKRKSLMSFLPGGSKGRGPKAKSMFASPPADMLHMAFNEDILDEEEKTLRHIARECNIPIPHAEGIKKEFTNFDEDGSGEIEKDEFQALVLHMMGLSAGEAKHMLPKSKLDQYWLSVGKNEEGAVGFPQFLVWYHQNFGAPKGKVNRKKD